MRKLVFSLALGCAIYAHAADPAIAYASFFGGNATDTVVSVMRDSRGYLYLAGSTNSKSLAVTDSGAQLNPGGDIDIFLMKIDPNVPRENAIVYATYFGGTGADVVKAAAIDGEGRVHITGSTTSTNFPVTVGAVQGTIGGTENQLDGFVITIDTREYGSASLVQATYLGGSDRDIPYAITSTPDGRTVVTGYTASTDFPLRGSSYQGATAGGWDAFVADFDYFGQLSYSTYFGGERTDIGRAVAVAPDGAIVVAGSTLSSQFPVIGEAIQNGYAGGGDTFLIRINTANGVSLSTYLGGSGLDEITGLAVSNNRAVITGFTTSPNFPTTVNAAKATLGGDVDGFVASIDLTAPFARALTYASYVGGSGNDVVYGLALDSTGNALVTGYTVSTDMAVTPGAVQPANNGAVDAFLARFDTTKSGPESLTYSTYIGGTGTDIGYAVATDADGKIYVAGSTNSPKTPGNGPDRTDNVGLDDGFILVLK